MQQKFNPISGQFDLIGSDFDRILLAKSGDYYIYSGVRSNSYTLPVNTSYLYPFFIHKISSLSVISHTSHTGTSVFRLGIYDYNEKTGVFTLLHDLNTVTATAASQELEAVLSQATAFDRKIFVAINCQSATGTASLYATSNSNTNLNPFIIPTSINALTTTMYGTNVLQITSNVSGGFPASYSLDNMTATNINLMNIFPKAAI